MRERLNFICDGATCAASLDHAAGATGLLIVSGGNEILSGAHRGMAWLAAQIAAAGHPVLRYDRRGIGDSEGDNGGYRSSAADIAAAAATLRSVAGVRHVAAFGNCDAATALALFGADAGIDRLILANPWTFDDIATDADNASDVQAALPTAAAIRARYVARLRDPRQLWRLITGGVDLRKLSAGLRAARKSAPASTGPGVELIAALNALPIPATLLLAKQDRTALAFAEHWRAAPGPVRARIPLRTVASGSHGFAADLARAWLRDHILSALA